ncbi:MAG: hypothetical protein K8S56_03875 [Candidatus Cloacimonetes bacterium]|nr:hypothetical protein [Candidatus Cloacimonadota bacterium]
MKNLENILDRYVKEAMQKKKSYVRNSNLRTVIENICRNIRNKAPIRFILSCCAAKIDNNEFDIRKPYTKIEGEDSYSGRRYDDTHIMNIIDKYNIGTVKKIV